MEKRRDVIHTKALTYKVSDMDKNLQKGERFTTVSTGGIHNESLVVDNITGKQYTLADWLKR